MDEAGKEGLAIAVEVYDPMEADMIKGLLEANGIKSIIHLKTHGSIAGIGESYGKIPIYVPESELEEAMALIENDAEESEKTDRDWATYVEKKHAELDKYLSWFWFAMASVFGMLAYSMPEITDEQKTFKAIFYGIAILAFVIMLRGLSEPQKKGRE